MISYRARWILPVSRPPISDGYVSVVGQRIVEVGKRSCGRVVDLGDVALTPGFVNAHTHLDLSGVRGRITQAASFTAWLEAVVAYRRQEKPAETTSAIVSAIQEIIDTGTTLAGDIAASAVSASLLANAGIPAVVFHEVLGLKPDRYEPLWQSATRFLGERTESASNIVHGISPHAPYSTASQIYHRAGQLGPDVPRATHWLETTEEIEFLRTGGGTLRQFLESMGALDEMQDSCRSRATDPWEMLSGSGKWVLIHANYLSADDVARLTECQANGCIAGVVFCPRTHCFFGHANHPCKQLLSQGIVVALGTDSLASNPDLSVFNEARFLAAGDHDFAPAALLEMLTRNGAQVLGRENETGTLAPGKRADLVTLAMPMAAGADPLTFMFSLETSVTGVMIGGRWKKQPPATASLA